MRNLTPLRRQARRCELPSVVAWKERRLARSGKYAFRVRSVERQHAPAKVHLRIGGARQDAEFVEGQLEYSFTMDSLDEGKAQLSAWTDGAGAPECAREVTIEFVKQ